MATNRVELRKGFELEEQASATEPPKGFEFEEQTQVTKVKEDKPILKKIGDIYEDVAVRPGAATRGALQSLATKESVREGYMKGAVSPEKVPYFQNIILDNYFQNTDNILKGIGNPTLKNLARSTRDTMGLGVSTVGFVADMASNPFDLLTEIATVGVGKLIKGLRPSQQRAVTQVLKNSDDLRRDKKFMEVVTEKMTKAIRPSKTGKRAYKDIKNLDANMAIAVDTILDNSEGLQYVDKAGDIVSQGKPQSLGELSQAVEQTKKRVWGKIRTVLDKADGNTKVDVTDIANDLKSLQTQLQKDLAPQAYREIDDLINGIKPRVEIELSRVLDVSGKPIASKKSTVGGIQTIDELEESIEMLNGQLKAFMSNPDPKLVSANAAKAKLVGLLRDKLDNTVARLTGEAIKPLKRQYGALAGLEKDITGRAIVAARQNPRGFFDLTDAFSGGAIAEGLMSLNPAKIAKGLVMGGTKAVTKALNNPNRMIATMFNEVEKIKFAKPPRTIPKTATTAAIVGTGRQQVEKLTQEEE